MKGTEYHTEQVKISASGITDCYIKQEKRTEQNRNVSFPLVITDRDRMRRRAGRRKVFLHCINIHIMMPAHWQNFMESVLRLVDLP